MIETDDVYGVVRLIMVTPSTLYILLDFFTKIIINRSTNQHLLAASLTLFLTMRRLKEVTNLGHSKAECRQAFCVIQIALHSD